MKKTFIDETPAMVGQQVTLYGWADTVRDHKKVVFVDMRDSSGLVQVVGGPDLTDISPEDVISLTGMVKERPAHMINDKIITGTIEIEAESFEILSQAKTLPMPINTDGYEIDEDVRMNYRYLDLRRGRMANNIKQRYAFISAIREHLQQQRFTEIETPILTKTSPEGARDFIVPSRLQPGKFYALPQSPQQYKQLLMVAGFERYFQIARCFRDEDPRADRAYGEFTQLDIEMSFVTQEDILALTETMFTEIIAKVFPDKKIQQSPWPRISHAEAMTKHGSDRPDLRKDPTDPDELAFAWVLDFPLFTKQSDEDYFHGSGNATFAPSHHMFTAPHPDDVTMLETSPEKVRGQQHDLVLNGLEVGGGSIRIHVPEIQSKVFDLIGFDDEQKSRFSDMLEAFTYGVPPHGGIAPGIDRMLSVILGEPSVREVIAFPTSSSGKTAVMSAPSQVFPDQLRELSIQTTVNEKNTGQTEKTAKTT